MEDALHRIQVWASHGTMKQFSAEVIAKLSKAGMEAELNGDTLTCYKVERKGGLFGKKERRPVLSIIRKGNEVTIPRESADPEFVEQLAILLKQH